MTHEGNATAGAHRQLGFQRSVAEGFSHRQRPMIATERVARSNEDGNMRAQFISPLMIVALCSPSAVLAHERPGSGHKPTEEFSAASICVENNATDGDTEIVLRAVPEDEGLRRFHVRAPDGRTVFTFNSADPTVLGMREFLLESPEPAGDRILAAYPEGEYGFVGRTHEGVRFFSRPRLSHRMPHATVILAPLADEEVPISDLLVRWSPVPGVAQYLLEIENESADPEQSLTINLPSQANSFLAPAEWLTPGSEYQVGVATVAANCNVVFVESTFRTAE